MYAVIFKPNCIKYTVLLNSTIRFSRHASYNLGFRCRQSSHDRNDFISPNLCISRKISFQQWPAVIANSSPVLYVQETLIHLHDSLGLQLWAVTLLVTVASLRSFVTLPLAIYQHYILAKYVNIQQIIPQLAGELKKEMDKAVQMYKWDQKMAKYVYRRSLKLQINKLIVADNCHPAKGMILILFQIPMWICFSAALRNMVAMVPVEAANAYVVHSQLTTGGLFWFSNLTVPDPTFILPMLLGIVNLSIIELHALRAVSRNSKLQKIFMNVMRGFCILIVPLAAVSPACISFYWLLSSTFGFGQNILLLMPRFRRMCQIPVTPNESATPFKDVIHRMKKK